MYIHMATHKLYDMHLVLIGMCPVFPACLQAQGLLRVQVPQKAVGGAAQSYPSTPDHMIVDEDEVAVKELFRCTDPQVRPI